MVKQLLLIFLFFNIITICFSQAIVERIKQDIYTLASDSFLGRRPYTKGDTLTVNYILNEFNKNRVQLYDGTGKQQISFLHKKELKAADLVINKISYQYKRDFVPAIYSKNTNTEADAVFVGYGLYVKVKDSVLYDYYYEANVKNKWLIVLTGKPETVNMPRSYYSENAKATIAKRKDAKGIIFVLKDNQLPEQDFYNLTEMQVPIIYITNDVFKELCSTENYSYEELMQKSENEFYFKPVYFTSKIKATISIEMVKGYSNNIIGITEGSDPLLKNEYIVVGAHHDHLGEKVYNYQSNSFVMQIFNGADDNASGISGMLELVRIVQNQQVKPKRSIIWVAFAAEEMGLIGSKEFVKNPPVPINQIKAMINLDMIGRIDEKTLKLSVSGTGTSKIFKKLFKQYKSKFSFNFVENPSGEGPSDHASFYRKNIPVLFLHSGLHEDYHQPTDDTDKINFNGMAQIINFAYVLLTDLANYPKKINFSETKLKQKTKSHNEIRISLGIIPDVSTSTEGLKVEGVREGSIAEKGGLKKGDIIISINGKNVKNIYDYMERLEEFGNEKMMKIKVKRNREIKELNVRLF